MNTKPQPRGRPPTGKIRLTVKVKPGTNRALYKAASKEGITKSEFVERAICERIERQSS